MKGDSNPGVLADRNAQVLDADTPVVVPTVEEMLRVKAYLVVQRNYVRDYLDVVGLADAVGTEQAVSVLGQIDDYYTDRSAESGSVLTALVTKLADPGPRSSPSASGPPPLG